MEQDNLSALTLESLPISVFIFNRRNEIIKFNQHFTRQYHHVFKGDIYKGVSLKNIFDEKLQHKLNHSWGRVLNGERFSQVVSFSANAAQYHWEFTYQPLINTGEISAGSAILKDISAEVQYQQQFIAANQDLLILKKTLDATMMFLEMDDKGIICEANSLFTSTTGYCEAELRGQHFSLLINKDEDSNASWSDIEANIASEKQWQGSLGITRKSGHMCIEAIISLIPGSPQHLPKYVLAAHQLGCNDNKNKAEQYAYATFADYEDENLWRWSLGEDRISCSEKWKATFGYAHRLNSFSLEEWRLLIHPEDRGKVINCLEQHIKGKTFFYAETLRLRCGDGTYRWVAEKGKFASDGYFIGKHEDIQKQKISEQSIVKQTRLYEEFIHHLPVGFYEANASGRFVKMNPALEVIYGITDKPGLIKALNIFNNRFILASGAAKHLLKAKNEKVVVKAEIKVDIKGSKFLLQRKDSLLHIELTIIPILDDKKELTGFITLHNDITERKRKETELKNSERLLREAGSMARIGGWEYHVEKAQYKWSEQVYNIFELSSEAALPANIAQAFFPEEEAKLLKVNFKKCVNRGLPLDMELPMITASGRHLWIRLKAQAVREDKVISRVIGLLQDITEDKRNEIELLHNRDFLKEAGQTAKIGAWEKDIGADKTFWAPELYKIFEFDASTDINEIDLYSYFSDGDLLKTAIADCKTYGKSFDLKLNMHTVKGNNLWIRAIGRAHLEARKVKRIHGIFQDITELYELTTQLHRRNELLNLFFENINMVYLALDENWNFTFVNKQATEILEGQQVIGENIWNTAPFNLCNNLEAAAKNAAASQQTATEEVNINETDEWYEFSVAPMKAGGISVFGRNITESKKLQSKLKASNEQLHSLNDYLTSQNKQMQDFTNISSHNLRSPVANIKGILSMMEMADSEEEKNQYINMLSDVVNRIDDTLHDLLEIAQLRNSLNIDKEELSFEEILTITKKNLIIDIDNTGTEIKSNFEKVPVIHYPRVYLESIFLNLISNSIKYHKPDIPPVITVETYSENNQIILQFTDNGSGMNMEQVKDKIFGFGKTFHQNKDAKGLGLYIIRNQVEAMGGEILVDSKPGEGTTFTIKF